jgi:hypothetical protein
MRKARKFEFFLLFRLNLLKKQENRLFKRFPLNYLTNYESSFEIFYSGRPQYLPALGPALAEPRLRRGVAGRQAEPFFENWTVISIFQHCANS